jgi:hypothetical protein
LLRLRNNYGNSFTNRCFNRFAMNSMHSVAAIYILMRRILVLTLRLQIANRRTIEGATEWTGQPNSLNLIRQLAIPTRKVLTAKLSKCTHFGTLVGDSDNKKAVSYFSFYMDGTVVDNSN